MITYLDYNATTPLDPRVFEAMRPYFLDEYGNAGSRTHAFGQRAKEAVDHAREQIAMLLGARSDEVIFTSGATESNNLVLLGLAQWGEQTGRRHIVSTVIEHKSVLEPLEWLRGKGFEVELAPVTATGIVEPQEVVRRVRKDTLLVSVMHANNETGVLQPVREISKALETTESMLHIDAAQSYGKEVETLEGLRCDFMSLSAHKVYGPKGVGALYARRAGGRKRAIAPLLFGGGQEMGIRPGTLPVPLVVGFGRAATLARQEYSKRRGAATRVKEKLLSELGKVEHQINGDLHCTQAHVVNVCFRGVDSEALMMALREVLAISNGSACTTSTYTPSHVLRAMGLSDEDVAASVRISWGPGVEVKSLPTEALVSAVRSLRG